MTPLELLRFLVPALASIDDVTVQQALDLAVSYRPACLPSPKQDEAQVWYAAWLLSPRLAPEDGTNPRMGIKRESEGDLEREYFGNGDESNTDPFGWHSRYNALAKLCGRGAITVGHDHEQRCPRY